MPTYVIEVTVNSNNILKDISSIVPCVDQEQCNIGFENGNRICIQIGEPTDESLPETDIADLGFGVRTFNCLSRSNINTLEQLCSKTQAQLAMIPNFDSNSMSEVIEVLDNYGLKLSEEN
jgi:DNA-directed RNA polymerase alpha subunit